MSAVNDLEGLLDHPHLASIDFWKTIEHPSEGMLRMPSSPIGLSDSPAAIRRLAPRLGEHTREVLREFDFADAEIGRLLEAGIVRQCAA